jgi:hypothetical protein
MTNQQHPITPPRELVMEWVNNHYGGKVHRDLGGVELSIAAQAAQWGADQELEACCERLRGEYDWGLAAALRLDAARRPNPPTLAEQATANLDDAVMRGDCITTTDAMPSLRSALARLAELEALHND